MLETMRGAAGGWAAKIMIALLVLAFAAFGIDQVNLNSTSGVMKVGDRMVTISAFRRAYFNELRRSGLPQDQAVALGFHHLVLQQLARREAVIDEGMVSGIDAPDDAVRRMIAANTTFQDVNGGFDRTAYANFLEQNSLQVSEFEENIRGDVTHDIMLNAVGSGAAVPRHAANAIWRRRVEQRDVSFVTLATAERDRTVDPTDPELQAFYENNPALFTSPEYRVAEIFWWRAGDKADSEAVSDEEARAVYEDRIDQYTTPQTRSFDRLIFETEDEASKAADALRSASEDAIAAVIENYGIESGANLGVQRLTGISEEQFADFDVAAARMIFAGSAEEAEGAIIGPLELATGWAVFHIASVRPETTSSFSEISGEIKRELALTLARSHLADDQTAIEDQRAGGASLKEIARQEGALFRVITVDAGGLGIDRAPIVAELPDQAQLLALIFPDDPTLDKDIIGYEHDMVQQDDGFFTAVVTEIKPESLKAFEAAREEVAIQWRKERAQERLLAQAAAFLSSLRTAPRFDSLAKAEGLEVKNAPGLRRGMRMPGVPQPVIDALFDPSAKIGATAQAPLDAAASQELGLDSDSANAKIRMVIGHLDAIQDATSESSADEIDILQDRLSAGLAADIRQAFARTTLTSREELGESSVDRTALAASLGITPQALP